MGRVVENVWPKFYPGCGWQLKYRDGKLVPCLCPSCVDQLRK